MAKPSLPLGTRDFGPVVMAKRQFLIETIKGVFKKFGFLPLETPAMENLDTLEGKYGDEGDQLLFAVLNSGDIQQQLEELIGITLIKLPERLPEFFSYVRNTSHSDKGANIDRVISAGINKLEPSYRILLRAHYQLIFDGIKNWLQFEPAADLNGVENMNAINGRRNAIVQDVVTEIKNAPNNSRIREFLTRRGLSEKGLRYDLTVPFARYVVMNRHEIATPFKRYQIQPVWRADRPQKGRYREFYQCDADVVGTDSLICEAEIILMIKEAFVNLGIKDYTIKINHRGVLSGLAEVAGLKNNETTLFVAIDKLDKIGEAGVRKELEERGISKQSIDIVFDALNKRSIQSETAAKGFADIAKVFEYVQSYGSTLDHVEHDLQLARGLSYYTGCIFEVKINNVVIGSVSGGGRYDNLTQAFGAKERLPGVGISFGIDRIYDAMEELKLFSEDSQQSTKVLVCCFDNEYVSEGLKVLHSLRQNNISSEIYPDNKKINKQLEYADKKSIPFALIIGADEFASKLYSIKNLQSGEQLKKSLEEIIKLVR